MAIPIFSRLRRTDCPEASPYMMSETFQISVSLRGAERRGNLLVPSINLLCNHKHRTGRLPRP